MLKDREFCCCYGLILRACSKVAAGRLSMPFRQEMKQRRFGLSSAWLTTWSLLDSMLRIFQNFDAWICFGFGDSAQDAAP